MIHHLDRLLWSYFKFLVLSGYTSASEHVKYLHIVIVIVHRRLKCHIITISDMFCFNRQIANSAEFAKTFLHFCFGDSIEQATDV